MLLNIYKDKQFLKFGITKLNFDKNELNKIINQINPLISNVISKNNYTVTLFSKDIESKKFINAIVESFIETNAPFLLNNYTILLSNLIIKPPKNGQFPVHQNWTFVDESVSRSYTLWIPLVNTTAENGSLEFVLGTHNLFNDEKRGHNTPYFFLKDTPKLNQYLIPFYLNLGEALLFDDAILHYSAINNSSQMRVAIQVTLVPKNSGLFHYAFSKGFFSNKLKTYQVEKFFFEDLDLKKQKLIKIERHKTRLIKNTEWDKISEIFNNFTIDETNI
jgi:ectoine hydroxylase-related dioxygenase (phytanoyl-CoA dioxygenase family)